ncbi:diphthine methyltransferase-like [Mercenaria mercenaria]|uniref:diphthine methyltransferase-like n=1 Tax=Mercenaria mercenaria TaxID=6596 RepID=UPI00234EEBF3|nr:diphthine methyltransferase-like [Mercenaria mercenaria]
MPGILDIKWSYQVLLGRPCFAVVNSVGQLKVFVVKEDSTVVMVTEEQLDTECLGLSLEWDNMLSSRDAPRIVSSDSKGCLHVHQLCDSCLKELVSWKAHDFEAWISAFDQWNTDIVYSGGDDCKLKVWDLRVGTHCPTLTSKRHSMGVCSVQSSPVHEYQLATGSYDENILLWDSRNMKQPVRELGLGGGVWRIKWEPASSEYILTATMYNGFHIVNTSGTELSVVLNYTEHQSIAYGADWCRISNKNTSSQSGSSPVDYVIGTCSFYDHTLKLWTYKDTNKDR